ncbi:GIY-YIG nuclease family protein [Streptomyces sp. NPDC056527]|uniref:GIY-YIG nuclease family protein n=1 Tax=Streptomyces sp. NPDC056527 TaxID=3345853 RepID=UPI0036BA733F
MTRTPLPTTARNRTEVVLERFIITLAWVMQAIAAATYVTVMVTSPMWRELPTLPVLTLGLFTISMIILWPLCLIEEQRTFYDRSKASLFRKATLVCHASVLLIAALAVADMPIEEQGVTWGVLGACGLCALGVWAARMHMLFLPAEDQAVIDALAQREAHDRAAAFDASEKERRHARLSAIVGALGYDLSDRTPTDTDREPEAPQYAWDIPARKHDPLVYFIRNGNRIKIGTTTELKRRIRTLALRPENVVLLVSGGQPLERAFHKQFADLRIGTTEWFAHDGALADFITDQNRLARKEEAK